jgi:hypothetical protein
MYDTATRVQKASLQAEAAFLRNEIETIEAKTKAALFNLAKALDELEQKIERLPEDK